MANPPERYCWDACTWIARLTEEAIVEDGVDRATRCKTVLELAKSGHAEIVCSALCLVEVCKDTEVREDDGDRIAAFFEHEFIFPVPLGREIGEKARELMMSGYGLKPPDACHIATALLTPGANALHTFDAKLRNLDGQLSKPDGTPLKICLPDAGGPVPPLLGGVQ